MIRGAIWWVWLPTLLLSTATQQKAHKSSLNLQMAMSGYDPLMTDVLDQPTHGSKATVFSAWQRDSIYVEETVDVINSFVDVADQGKCTPSLTEATVTNYESYKSLSSAVISFATEGDVATKLGSGQFSFDNNAGHGNRNNPNAAFIRQYFDENHGEARIIKAECVTHTVRILPFIEPVFTPAFLTALAALNMAATDTDFAARQKVYREFVRYYGTHFPRTTHFGYAAYFGRLYATRANTTVEEAARRKCMLESARDALTPGARRGCETTRQHFSRAVADKCREEAVDVLVTETGSRSDDHDLAANEFPKPVAYILEKFSSLFERSWMSSLPTDLLQARVNGTALSAFFEEMSGPASQDVIERAKTPTAKQGLWRRYIAPNVTEVDPSEAGFETSSSVTDMTSPSPTPPPATPSPPPAAPGQTDVTSSPRLSPMTCVPATPTPTTPAAPPATGAIVIVGGRRSWGTQSTPNSLALFGPAPPLFPVAVSGNTLTRIGTQLFSCGGDESDERGRCWYIDTRAQGTWQSFAIPWRLNMHCAVAVKDEIWFFLDTKLMILHTMKTEDKFREIDLGFVVHFGSAAVAHGLKTFVIGVGGGKNDIYVNTNSSEPEQWKIFTQLLEGRGYFGCITVGAEIFVTGGREPSKPYDLLSSVEVISVVNRTVRSISPMRGVRRNHQMAIIQGRPAVLGGWNGTHGLATIETYDEESDSWETLGVSLAEPRYYFGLTQYSP